MRRTSESSSVCVCWEEAFKKVNDCVHSFCVYFWFHRRLLMVQSDSMDEQPATLFAFKRMFESYTRLKKCYRAKKRPERFGKGPEGTGWLLLTLKSHSVMEFYNTDIAKWRIVKLSSYRQTLNLMALCRYSILGRGAPMPSVRLGKSCYWCHYNIAFPSTKPQLRRLERERERD